MVMGVADAGVLDRPETEPGSDRPVRLQPPTAHVAVPAGLELADQHDFLGVDVDGDAGEVPDVAAGVEHRGGRVRAEAESGCDRGTGGLESALLVSAPQHPGAPLPSAEEREAALAVLGEDPELGPKLHAGDLLPYRPMPPLAGAERPDGKVERTITVGLRPADGRSGHEIVGVHLAVASRRSAS